MDCAEEMACLHFIVQAFVNQLCIIAKFTASKAIVVLQQPSLYLSAVHTNMNHESKLCM